MSELLLVVRGLSLQGGNLVGAVRCLCGCEHMGVVCVERPGARREDSESQCEGPSELPEGTQ